MYAAFFGLQHEPFSIAPDPRYLFMSERHREALAHLLYGVQGGGGFVLLSGEIGAGKTTVCRCFLEQVPAHCKVAYIFNPKLTVPELLHTICEEFGIETGGAAGGGGSIKDPVDRLNAFLLESHAAGRSNVLVIDEAQNLAPEVLEQLRLLTNLETRERKLLQIILIGQPELREMLARPGLEQLAQRVIARYHLGALTEAETAQYVRHRLDVAGAAGDELFDAALLRRVHRLARGVPRRINLLCDRALLGAYAQGRRRVDRATLARAAAEVFDEGAGAHQSARGGAAARRLVWLGLSGALVATAAAAAALYVSRERASHAAAPVPAPASAPAAASAAPVSAPAAAAPAPAPAASAVSLALRNERDAWRELALAWGAELPASDEDDPCPALKAAAETSAAAALRCFRSDEGLALLRLLGRPAILTLHDGSGRPSYVILTGLAEQQATVRAGGAEQRVGLLALGQQWRGEFATLWRVPPGYGERLEPGPAQDWVRARLEQLFGAPPDGATAPPALRERIAAFQRAQGLKSDGRAGPITLMQLNRAAGVDEPRLAF